MLPELLLSKNNSHFPNNRIVIVRSDDTKEESGTLLSP